MVYDKEQLEEVILKLCSSALANPEEDWEDLCPDFLMDGEWRFLLGSVFMSRRCVKWVIVPSDRYFKKHFSNIPGESAFKKYKSFSESCEHFRTKRSTDKTG